MKNQTGCLKGCLVSIVVIFIAWWVARLVFGGVALVYVSNKIDGQVQETMAKTIDRLNKGRANLLWWDNIDPTKRTPISKSLTEGTRLYQAKYSACKFEPEGDVEIFNQASKFYKGVWKLKCEGKPAQITGWFRYVGKKVKIFKFRVEEQGQLTIDCPFQ